MDFKRVLVIGAGPMGSGIAQVMAQGGLEVIEVFGLCFANADQKEGMAAFTDRKATREG